MTDEDDFRDVVAYLAEDVAPPDALEDRVMAAALARRPAAATSIASAPSARRSRTGTRVAAAATVLIAAAAVVMLVIVVGNNGTTQPSGRVQAIGATRADVAAVQAQPGARNGTMTNGFGHVVLGADGKGYVFDIPSAEPVFVWVDGAGGSVPLGEATPQQGVVGFTVNHASAVRTVILANPFGHEYARAELTR